MLRLLATLGLAALLSGCLADQPAAPVLDAAVPDDGLVVMATRVEANPSPIDVVGAFELRSCDEGGCTSSQLPQVTDRAWLGWDPVVLDYGDPAALFWRVAVKADWGGQNTVEQVRLSVFVTRPCGIACLTEREVGAAVGARSLVSGEPPVGPILDTFDVYLRPGETGVRVRFEIEQGNPGLGPTKLDYHVQGTVAAYRAVGEPFAVA